ncbi:MAG TPA: type II toxin-antitoxin system RelE/ParE family toxin [Pseudolabrys sp.]|nr:type II toxin-antitoxin system RelE/ParE family toxin [Pseudolabrys sp.]
MIRSFGDKATAALFHGRGCDPRWQRFERVALRKLLMVNAAASLHDLKSPPNNRLEALKKDRLGQHAIRINGQYRVCFVWSEGHAEQVEIVDYH